MDPSEVAGSFDSLHVGVGDVVQLPNGTLWMYYFGGGQAGGMPGINMQVGLAASQDGGFTWQRLNRGEPILRRGAAGSFDEVFVSWPRVLPPWETQKISGWPAGKWYLSYHTYNMSKWSVGAAVSDDGFTWERLPGPVLAAGEEGSWDCTGIGVRSLAVVEAKLWMFYEAVDAVGKHAIGIAESTDGVAWHKRQVPGCSQPGGPVLSKGPEGAFDDKHVGTPYVMPAPADGTHPWRLYFVGAPLAATMAVPLLSIGVAESLDGDLSLWQRVGR